MKKLASVIVSLPFSKVKINLTATEQPVIIYDLTVE